MKWLAARVLAVGIWKRIGQWNHVTTGHLWDSTLSYAYMEKGRTVEPCDYGSPLGFHATSAGQQFLTYGSMGYMSTGAVLGYA